MEALKSLNLAVRFLLELAMLISFGYWGFMTCSTAFTRWLLGIGAPLLVAMIWGAWIAPKAARRLDEPARSVVEIGLFALAFLALFSSGQESLALIFGLVYLVQKVLRIIWKQTG